MDDNSPADSLPKVHKAASAEQSSVEKPPVSWLVPVVTAVILISVFCIYYFVYVRAQRDYLTNRNFRALATLGDQLQTIISVHSSVLGSYEDLATHRHKLRHREKEYLNRFLVVRPEDQKLPPDQQRDEAEKDYLKYLAPNFAITKDPNVTGPPEHRLRAQRRAGRWELELVAQHRGSEPAFYRGSLDLDVLLNPLVGSQPFDEILLVSEKGTVVYQNKNAGPQFTTLTSLLQAQPSPANKEIGALPVTAKDDTQDPITRNADPTWRNMSKNLTDVVLAGTRYKLFLQPILIDVYSDDPNHHEPAVEWVLCGLKSAAGLQWESLSISYTFIIWITAVFFAISMSGPILKIILLNHRERLRLREVGFLGLFLVLLTSVFTLSGLQAVEFPLNDDTEARLQQLGDNLSASVWKELGDMRAQLKNWCGLVEEDLQAAKETEVIRNAPTSGAVSFVPGTIKKTPAAPLYPYLNNVFWTDDDGHQVVKWSLSGYLTPMIDISTLPIFTNPKTTYLDGKPPAFYFDSILPPNKLEYLATITMTTEDCDPHLSTAALGDIRGDIKAGAAFLTAQPLSLIDPVLPLGYGFALVDQNGLVLFHSDKTKNKRENFRQESDWSRQLYAATFGHAAPHSLPIKYLGTDYRALVIPIPGVSQSPWSLIVYRDLTPVRTLNLQVMTMAATLLLWLLSVPVVIMAVWGIIRRPLFAPEWLWPNRARMGAYLYLIYVYILLIISFLLLGFGGSGERTAMACATIPYTALLLTWWCFRLYPCSAEQPIGGDTGRSLAAPATVSILGAIFFLAVLLFQWTYLKPLTFLLFVVIACAVPLLNGPRHFLNGWLNHHYPPHPLEDETSVQSPRSVFGYRNSYMLGVLLLLLLIGVLTPMALFQASLSVERRLGLKQAQLHLASALGARLLQASEQCDRGDLGEAACNEFQKPDSGAWRKIVFDPLFPANGSLPVVPHSIPPAKELYSGWFQELIYTLHHDYNKAASEMLGVIQDRNVSSSGKSFPEWSWANDTSTASLTLRWHGIRVQAADNQAMQNNSAASQPASENDLLIQSVVPATTGADAAAGFGVAAGVMLAIGILFSVLARKLFLFQVAPMKITAARQVTESLQEGRNIVVLLPPVSDWQLEPPKWTLDLATLPPAPGWAEALNLDKIPMNTVAEIRHFEHSTDNIEIDNQKFILLQRLLARENTQIAVVITVPASTKDYRRIFPAFEVIDLREEPFHWLKQYEGPAQDLIWKECGPLAALWPLGAQLAKDIKNDPTHSEDTVASEILERADPYYRLIWKECSKEQKFVLAQLAEDGLPNPTNARTIGQLMRRGLIVKDPQFRIMNESFRRFLRSAATPHLKQEWLHESRRTGWGKLHGAFFTTMIILGIFLLTTQNALWESSAAYVTTALGALGTLAKMLNMFRAGTATGKDT